MITEDYVSYETAKFLKEKGFDGAVSAHYSKLGGMIMGENPISKNTVKCPTLQMAMKWLREMHKIDITVDPHKIGNNWIYQFHICQNKDYLFSKDIGTSYENCAESAIKYCLKNLI